MTSSSLQSVRYRRLAHHRWSLPVGSLMRWSVLLLRRLLAPPCKTTGSACQQCMLVRERLTGVLEKSRMASLL